MTGLVMLRAILRSIWMRVPLRIRARIGRGVRRQSTQRQLSRSGVRFGAIKGQLPDVPGSQTVLVWRGPGEIKPSLNIELVIAAALTWREAGVKFVLCDGLLSGCLRRSVENGESIADWPNRCPGCSHVGTSSIEAVGLPYRHLGEWVTSSRRAELRVLADDVDLADIASWQHYDVPAGQYALSSTVRYFKGKGTETDDAFASVLREYFYSSLVSTEAARAAVTEMQPAHVFMQHGIYVDWGPMFSRALGANIPVTRWMRGYLKNHLYLRTCTQEDARHMYYLADTTWQTRARRPLGALEKERLNSYMRERACGSQGAMQLFNEPPFDPDSLRRRLDLPSNKPIWAIFTHLDWDAVFAFEPILFRDPTEWVLETLKAIVEIPDVTWVIKIHPAERILGTARGSQQTIAEHFPSLPSHVRLIPADSQINTYGLLPLLHGGVTIRGTVGLELAMLGKPVILAGEAHYGAKGFTYDSQSKDQYFALLQQASSLNRTSVEQMQVAQRYAYSFFIERQIPFELVSGNGQHLAFESLDDLRPGRSSVLDMICERVLEGGEFTLNGN